MREASAPWVIIDNFRNLCYNGVTVDDYGLRVHLLGVKVPFINLDSIICNIQVL